MSDPDQLTFDELIATLHAWAGKPSLVLCGPASAVHPPGAGVVWARLRGILRPSEEGRGWACSGRDQPDREAIAFQVGEDPDTYLVFYRELFTGGYWVSREHGFLIAEMGSISIGVSVSPGDVEPRA